jgi:hypothetical protein
LAISPVAGPAGAGLASPAVLRVHVRDAEGEGLSILDGVVAARSAGGEVLFEAPIPGAARGSAVVDLTWDGEKGLAGELDVRLRFLDGQGAVHEIERRLAL